MISVDRLRNKKVVQNNNHGQDREIPMTRLIGLNKPTTSPVKWETPAAGRAGGGAFSNLRTDGAGYRC
jgi:hypothetical protein